MSDVMLRAGSRPPYIQVRMLLRHAEFNAALRVLSIDAVGIGKPACAVLNWEHQVELSCERLRNEFVLAEDFDPDAAR